MTTYLIIGIFVGFIVGLWLCKDINEDDAMKHKATTEKQRKEIKRLQELLNQNNINHQ